MPYSIKLLTTSTLCAFAVYALYLYGMVATYSDTCASVACQMLWG